MKARLIALIIATLMLLTIIAMSATPNITGGCKTEIDTTKLNKLLTNQANHYE